MTTFEKIRKAALARLEAGEPAHIILQDYADYEDELRPLLEGQTGKSLSSLPTEKPKFKTKNTSQSSMLPIMLGAIIVLVLGLAAAVFFFVPVSSGIVTNVQSVQTETTCIGIAQAQISSVYAQQAMNQQVDNNSVVGSSSTGSVVVDSVEYESVEESDDVGAAPVDSEFVMGSSSSSSTTGSASTGASGGISGEASTGGGAGADTSEVSVSSVSMTATPAPTSLPSAVSDDAADMDMEEPAAPPLGDSSAESRTASSDVADEAVASDGYAPEADEAPVVISTEPLRAGEIDDNAEWDDYQDYRNDFLDTYGKNDVRNVDTTGRQVIRVIDNEGNPVLDACVEIYHGDTHINSTLTYATGMTMFFPNLSDATRYVDNFRVVVSKGNVVAETSLDREVVGGVTTIELPISQQIERVQLDVMFLLDATGSMGEEIAQLQGNILTISEQIDALPDNVDVRYGLVTYRDRGDQYVTRVYDFTSDVSEFQENLVNVRASGGGDYPESLNEGLDMALNAVEWRTDDTVRLMFLVADAPPHVDYQDDADYSLLMQGALSRGIKIHQIASGGLQPAGEFVMRQIGQYTMGRFLFLTYEDGVSGEAGEERTDLEVGDPEDEQGVGDYSVTQLDELVLRLITDEIAALRGE